MSHLPASTTANAIRLPGPSLERLPFLEALAAATHGLVLLQNLQTGRIEHASGSAKDLLGLEAAELRGAEVARVRERILPVEAIPQGKADFARLASIPGQALARQSEFQARGSGRWIRATLTPYDPDSEGTFERVLLVGTDVTEDRATLEAVQEEQRQLHELTDLLPQVVFELDPTGAITYANQALLTRFGYTPEEAVQGLDLLQLIVPEERERAAQALRSVLTGGHTGREYWGLRKDGSRFPVVAHASPIVRHGIPVGLRGLFVDLTEQKRVETALRESEQVYRAIFENTGNASIITNESGTILLANAEWERLSGYSREECEGRLTWREFIEPGDLERLSAYSASRYAGEGGAPREYEFTFRTRSGERRQVINHVGLIPGTRQSIAFLADVTDRRLAEAEREQLQARLRQVEKLEAIGQLAGGIAHDFNNYLSTIQGFAEILADQLPEPSLRRYTDKILRSCGRAADLTRQLLAFARKGKLFSVPMEVHPLVEEVVGLLQHSLDRRIQLQTRLEASTSVIVGDPTQIQNALMNMAINSRDAMPEGGTLTFATALRVLDEDYCRRMPYALEPGAYLQISITDTGQGMDAETQQRIFEPFFTTKEQGKGTGLGMASVYGIVKHHKGAINVYSEVGRGTCIKIYLPLAESGTPLPEAVAAPVSNLGVSRILVVEDEELVSEMATEMLQALGYQVTLCRDGQEAVAFFRESWREIDLVLLDLIMPRMGGRETFNALRAIHPDVRVLLSSGFSVEGDAQAILNLGALGFLQKPYQKTELAQRIQEALAR